MANDPTQAQYDQLAVVSRQFTEEGERIGQIHGRVTDQVSRLSRGGWLAEGAQEFYRQMETDVLPGIHRLQSALNRAGMVTLEIIRLLQNAEEEAAANLNGESGTGDPAVTPVNDVLAKPAGDGRDDPMPNPPPNPGQPNSGDGSGVHGAMGDPTQDDWDNHSRMSTLALGARLQGHDIAASHMEHFLGNSGDQLNVDVNRMMSDMPEFRSAAQQQFNDSVLPQVNDQITQNYNGQPMQFTVTTDWRSDYYPSKEDYPNWYFGVGGFSYSQTAVVNVTPDPNGGAPIVTIESETHMFDRYNWDAGKSVTIPDAPSWLPGPVQQWVNDNTAAGDFIPDNEVGRLHGTGIAQEYDLSGTSDRTTTTYTYDPNLGIQPQTPPEGGR